MEFSTLNEKTLVLIPFFNEEEKVFDVISSIKKVFDNILCINDGSTDSTFKILKNISQIDIISHPTNCGQGTAILTGIKFFLHKTDFEYLITFDGDGQHSINDAKLMLMHIQKHNLDAVFGSRFIEKDSYKNMPFKRIILLKLAIFFEKTFYRIKLSDAHNGLRVLRKSACERLEFLECSEMAHSTEIAFRISNDSKLKIGEYQTNIKYLKNAKGSQIALNFLNIISELIQRK